MKKYILVLSTGMSNRVFCQEVMFIMTWTEGGSWMVYFVALPIALISVLPSNAIDNIYILHF